jgi:N-acetylglucosaminyldiphosphoundecaprenol N-acetyl-beta-D-mannosaminyltransferase
MKKILISAFNGVVNVGSESILQETINFLRKNIKDAEIEVMTWNEEHTRSTYDTKAVSHFSIRQIKSMVESDFYIFGGGDLITDIDKGLLFWMSKYSMAYLLGNKIITSGVGVRPITTPLGRFIVKKCLKKSRLVTVRDTPSKNILQKIGIDDVHVVADPGILVEPCDKKTVRNIMEENNIDRKKNIIGVSLAHWLHLRKKWSSLRIFDPTNMIKTFSRLFDNLIKEGYEVVLIPTQIAPGTDDREIAEAIRKEMKNSSYLKTLKKLYSPSEMVGLIKELDAMVSMKLHGLIFSFAALTPCMAVGYGYAPRVVNFINEVGYGNFSMNLETMNYNDVKKRLYQLLQKAERKKIKEKRNELRSLARENFRLIKELMETEC